MSIIISGTTGIDAGSLPVANTGKISAGSGLPVILNTAGVDRVTVDTAGNVGIGTSSPSAPLEIATKAGINAGVRITQGTSNATNAILQFTDNPVTKQIGAINVANDGIMTIYTGTSGIETIRLDSSGNVLLTSGTGGLGYGTGAGGTVTQLTSKSTAVTLNKPTGQIISSNSALAAGATVEFALNNSLITSTDQVVINNSSYTSHKLECRITTPGVAYIQITNTSGSSLSVILQINFTIIKGAIA